MWNWFGRKPEHKAAYTSEVIARSLDVRLRDELAFYQGNLPERVAIAWRGYLAGLLEWGYLDLKDHGVLWAMLPTIENDPVVDILTGREDG